MGTKPPPLAKHTRPGIRAALVCLGLAGSMLVGCGRPGGVVFSPLSNPPAWPPPPAQPRVAYIGQLATRDDLKPAKSFTEVLGQWIFGQGPNYSMLSPYAVGTDQADRVFVADSNGQTVHVFNLESREYQRWQPSEEDGPFAQPVGIVYDPQGRLIVADSVAGCLFVFDDQGKSLGTMGQEYLSRPCGLALDAKGRRLFIADPGAHRVVVLDADDGHLIQRLGKRGKELGQFNFPTNVALDHQGRLYVSDSLNFRVQLFAADLTPLRQVGSKGDLPGYFSQPKGVAVDRQDRLYVVDAHFEAVQIFDPDGHLLMSFGQEGLGPGQFWLPAGIHIDKLNRVWIADVYNRRLQVFDTLLDFPPEEQP